MVAKVQDVFMLVGDSLTQGGWAPGDTGIGQRLARSYHLFSVVEIGLLTISSFEDAYARKLDVLNRGYSGYNTEWALPVLDQVRSRINLIAKRTHHPM